MWAAHPDQLAASSFVLTNRQRLCHRCTKFDPSGSPWFSNFYENRCKKTIFYPALSFVISTLLAQVILTIRFGTLSIVYWLWADSHEFYHRMYAVSLKNVRITVVFAIITASQLVVGIILVTLNAREGGKTLRSSMSSSVICAQDASLLFSSVIPSDTPRRLSWVCIYPTQIPRGRVYEPLPPLWWVPTSWI